jgi:hypothetical protein
MADRELNAKTADIDTSVFDAPASTPLGRLLQGHRARPARRPRHRDPPYEGGIHT